MLKVRDQTREFLPTLILAGGLVVHLVKAPVATLVLLALNLIVRCNAHRNLKGSGRILVFLLMNAVMCFVMGTVSEFYANTYAWVIASVLLTAAFSIKQEPVDAYEEAILSGKAGFVSRRGLGDDNRVIDVAPIDQK